MSSGARVFGAGGGGRTLLENTPNIWEEGSVLDRTERNCWLALAVVPGIGARRHRALVSHFGSARAAWSAPLAELVSAPGATGKTTESILSARGEAPLAAAEHVAARVEDGPWQVICLPQQEYPDPLREMYDPPAAVWVRGVIPASPAVAIVGSRRATPYGTRVARRLAGDLADAGVTVVSGLARGIDAAAHAGALAAGGKTVAMLGCGIDRVYPSENARLYEEIGQSGALVSELPPGFEPLPGNFPARNRLISGLAAVTIVVEAGERSGALITADLALEQGREVMAVPGNITSLASVGCNRLIAQGARPLLSSADVLELLSLTALTSGTRPTGEAQTLPDSAGSCESDRESGVVESPEARILSVLDDCGAGLDEILARTGLPASDALAALTALQLGGRIETLPGGRFVSFSRQR